MEGLANSAVEAIGSGLPVIARNIPGMSEVILHERTGILVPARNPSSLAAAILRLGEAPQWRKQFGNTALEHDRQKFDINKSVQRLLDIYDELIIDEPKTSQKIS